MQGSEACCEGAIRAGARFFAGYPITPATEICEKMSEIQPKIGGRFIQMEDEIASVGAICGASLAGYKAFTATSGPGFSLMQEMIGYASMTEIPIVVVDVQRMGPSTGNIYTAQEDVMQAKYGSNGDRGVIALSPGNVTEAFEMTIEAFNLAEKYRTPVILLLDETVAHMRQSVTLPDTGNITVIDRKKPSGAPEDFEPYAPDEEGITTMGVYGTEYYSHLTGLIHDHSGIKSNDADTAKELVTRLNAKIDGAVEDITRYKTYMADDADYLFLSFGCSSMSCIGAVKKARAQGVKAGLLKLQTIWPLNGRLIREYAANAKKVIVTEMNYGQLAGMAGRYVSDDKLISMARINGELFNPAELAEEVKELAGRN